MSQPEFKRIVTPEEAAWPAPKLVGLLLATLAVALFVLKTLAGRMGY
jgi:hypothetical protein